MLSSLRAWSGALLAAVQRVADALEAASVALPEQGNPGVSARLDELERRQALWEAEVEGELAKAVQERKNARNAEERTRAMASRLGPAEGDLEGEEELPEEYAALISGRDGSGGEAGGVQTMRHVLGPSREAQRDAARRYKFGG